MPIIRIRITNNQGKTVFNKQNLDSEITIQTKDLAEGQYIIEAILEDNTKLIKKFVVQ